MKKILITLFALFILVGLKANPIMLPTISLSELYFEEQGKWVIELQYSFAYQDNMPIDSIWIKTSSGISAVKRFNITGSTGLIIVRSDSLLSTLNINPVNDFIQVIYTFSEWQEQFEKPPVVYGKLMNSILENPKKGQSIAGVPDFEYTHQYSIDKSPTIGTKNDLIGMCGTFTGHIYDKNNELVSIEDIKFYNTPEGDLYISPDLEGFYSIPLVSKRYQVDKLAYYIPNQTGNFTVNITPLDFTMAPDSLITMQIHILNDLMVGIHEIDSRVESVLKIFPNPVKGVINYEIAIPVSSTRCYMELVNMNGQKMDRFAISENKGAIELPSGIDNGVYFINLYANSKNYSSSKIVISK